MIALGNSFLGRHMIEVFIEEQPVDGSPFACNVYNINNIKVTGLDNAKVRYL